MPYYQPITRKHLPDYAMQRVLRWLLEGGCIMSGPSRRFWTWDFASDRSEAKSDVPLAIRTTGRIAVLEGGLNGRGVDRPIFPPPDGNPEGTPHVLRIPAFRRLVSEGCPRPRMLYRIQETGSGA